MLWCSQWNLRLKATHKLVHCIFNWWSYFWYYKTANPCLFFCYCWDIAFIQILISMYRQSESKVLLYIKVRLCCTSSSWSCSCKLHCIHAIHVIPVYILCMSCCTRLCRMQSSIHRLYYILLLSSVYLETKVLFSPCSLDYFKYVINMTQLSLSLKHFAQLFGPSFGSLSYI